MALQSRRPTSTSHHCKNLKSHILTYSLDPDSEAFCLFPIFIIKLFRSISWQGLQSTPNTKNYVALSLNKHGMQKNRKQQFTHQKTESRSPIIFIPSLILFSFSPTIRISKYVINCDNAITMYSGITTRNATIQSERIL
jgi:hypothetical protein